MDGYTDVYNQDDTDPDRTGYPVINNECNSSIFVMGPVLGSEV